MRSDGSLAITIFILLSGGIIEAFLFYLFDIDPDDIPAILLIILWVFNSGVVGYLYWRFFGDGRK